MKNNIKCKDSRSRTHRDFSDESRGKIYTTTNYSMFKAIVGNRHLDEKNVKIIEQSMRESGWKTDQYVHINKDGTVTDGQHRIEAAKRTGTPVKYIINDVDVDINDIIHANIHGKKAWTHLDLIRSAADRGDSSCVNLLALHKKYTEIPKHVISLGVILYVVSGKTNINVRKTDHWFDFPLEKFDEYDRLLCSLQYLAALIRKNNTKSGRLDYFLCALTFMIKNGASVDRLANKIEKWDRPITPAGNTEYALEQLEEIYNRRSGEKVYFVSDYKRSKGRA